MKKILNTTVLFVFCQAMFGQKISSDQFTFEKDVIKYSYVKSKKDSNKFYVVIVNEDIKVDDIEKTIKKCSKNNKSFGNIYYVVVSKIYTENFQQLMLEFLTDVMSKRKLIDKEMNIISDRDFRNFYDETRIKNKSKYKNCFLNPINKFFKFEAIQQICDFIN